MMCWRHSSPTIHHLIQIKKPKHQMMMVMVMPQGKVTVRKSMMGTSQTTMMNRDNGMKTWSRKMTGIYSNGVHYENGEDFDDYNYDNGDDEY